MAPSGKPTVVVMGVSGSGKSTLGGALARRLDAPFQEGDALHPPENIARMRAGEPLSDADRAPWLERIAAWIMERDAAGTGGVITCSALKRAYRDRLRAAAPDVAFVFLAPDDARLRARLAARRGHYMSASLLDSQLATLEPPAEDEADVLRLPGEPALEAACDAVLAWLADRTGGPDAATPEPGADSGI